MRLWSIHPRYLDSRGLVALWREGLLAKKVLSGRARGYRNHPQLERFKKTSRPARAINDYLAAVLEEAEKRGYAFDARKVSLRGEKSPPIRISSGQLRFEFRHLLAKLKKRDTLAYRRLLRSGPLEAHPLFRLVQGRKEPWEKG